MEVTEDETATPTAEEESISTKSDPLSSATRAAKRNLLAASLVAVTFKAFNISVEKISVVGVNMDFDRGVFEFLMLMSLLYFLVTFCLYYYIDIKNFPRTPHEHRTEHWKQRLLEQFTQDYWEETSRIAREKGPTSKRFDAWINNRYADYLTATVSKPLWPTVLHILKRQGSLPPYADFETEGYISTSNKPGFIPQLLLDDRKKTEADIERDRVVAELSAIATERARAFPKRYRWYKWQLMPRLATVRGAYLLRNYGTDGVLPISFALFALASLYGLIDVTSLRRLVPRDAGTIG